MKLGLYGGTFDPIHNGHLLLAEWTREQLRLDKIIFVPAYIPPHKKNQRIIKAEQRLQMIRLAIHGNPYFEVSDLEVNRGDVSYSIHTIMFFRNQFHLSREQLFFMIGADNLLDLHSWHQPDNIMDNCKIVVYRRPGIDISGADKVIINKITILNNPLIDISSSHIRQNVAHDRSIRYMVPTDVEEFIYRNSLYKKKS